MGEKKLLSASVLFIFPRRAPSKKWQRLDAIDTSKSDFYTFATTIFSIQRGKRNSFVPQFTCLTFCFSSYNYMQKSNLPVQNVSCYPSPGRHQNLEVANEYCTMLIQFIITYIYAYLLIQWYDCNGQETKPLLSPTSWQKLLLNIGVQYRQNWRTQ